uniref:Transmembrane protein n=1 Tax=Macrostomum lignano TaxID=282301 RepID=A0A1I8HHQ7_9PLAT
MSRPESARLSDAALLPRHIRHRRPVGRRLRRRIRRLPASSCRGKPAVAVLVLRLRVCGWLGLLCAALALAAGVRLPALRLLRGQLLSAGGVAALADGQRAQLGGSAGLPANCQDQPEKHSDCYC